MKFKVGDKVIFKLAQPDWDNWQGPGVITKINSNETYQVTWETGNYKVGAFFDMDLELAISDINEDKLKKVLGLNK